MGHFALTDVSGGRFRAFERFARGGGGLAGATPNALDVWLEDWALASQAPVDRRETASVAPAPAGDAFPLRLAADGDGVDLELRLESGKPAVAQGVNGLSRKGAEVGNASYYYSFTRMPATGRLVLDGDTIRVSGLAWLDREWSTSALSEGQVGWDWFALQLDDGWEMMVYQLRHADGSADEWSDGVLIDPRGRRVPLEWGREIEVTSTGSWTSPIDGARYPSGWRIVVPERGWDLVVTPAVLDQELQVAFRYWEGAVVVSGAGEGGRLAQGRGYVELTGYAERTR
jgi:predicted secreted hydrolase